MIAPRGAPIKKRIMKTYKEQKATLKRCIQEDGLFRFPCCQVEIVSMNAPVIENPNNEEPYAEDKTQIMCQYGCGYIFIEDYLHE